MSGQKKRPLDNPLLPSEEEVLEFNPHARKSRDFGYNRLLLASENIEVELSSLKGLAAQGKLTDVETRLLNLVEAKFWESEMTKRYC